jgi:hypothetical protein
MCSVTHCGVSLHTCLLTGTGCFGSHSHVWSLLIIYLCSQSHPAYLSLASRGSLLLSINWLSSLKVPTRSIEFTRRCVFWCRKSTEPNQIHGCNVYSFVFHCTHLCWMGQDVLGHTHMSGQVWEFLPTYYIFMFAISFYKWFSDTDFCYTKDWKPI